MLNFKKYGWVFSIALVLGTAPAQGAEQASQFNSAEAVVRQYVLKSGPWPVENVEVRVLPFQAVPLPPGAVSFRILKPTKGITPGTVNFLLAADVAGKEHNRFWVKAEVRVFDDVVVSSAPLARQEWIDTKNVRIAHRDISALTARPFTRIDEVAGQQAAHAIEVNEILTQKSIDRPTLMRRGSPITLLYETGTLRVESPGVSADNGKIGDVIQVKNPNSGKLLRGVVLDERTVRVN